jgi:ATP-dependent DNA helicase DinG
MFARSIDQPRSWVLTSATLGSDEDLTWFTRGVGLEGLAGLRTLRLPSPFDHVAQASLYVPQDLPEPGDDAHAVALADAVWRWAKLLGGRTLVLTTSLRAVHRIATQLIQHQQLGGGEGEALELLVQGRLSKPALLERFRQAGERTNGAILVASASFWEGVDLPGAALQLLVIDKLPFPPPDDPLLAAQVRRSEAKGESAFESVMLPEAAMALKQGVGRLIRSETDRGVVVIADRRLLTRSYGQSLLNSLPAMSRLMNEVQLLSALEALAITRSSTTGHHRV